MGPSFLEELQALRDNVRAEAQKTLNVHGSGGRVQVKFRPPAKSDPDALERLGEIIAIYRVGGPLTRAQEKQLIIDCCEEILVRNGDGELHQPEGGPLRFDASDDRWGQVSNAHDCVDRLYNLDTIPLAISGISDTLVDWLQGLDAEVRARVEGNSQPAADEDSSGEPPT